MNSVSIIVPVYNARRWLTIAVQSVQAQTYANWELILIDDGSTDGSGDLCERLSRDDSRIRVHHQKNSGVSAARNMGIDISHGNFISFLDADDELAPNFLECMVDTQNRTKADIISCYPQEYTEDYHPIAREGSVVNLSPYAAIREVWLQHGLIETGVWGKLYHKSIFEHERFTPGRYEDLDALYRLFSQANHITVIPQSLYGYRQHGESFLHKYTPGRLDALKVTAKIEEWAERQDDPSLLSAARERRMSANFNIFQVVETARRSGEISAKEADKIQENCFLQIKRLRKNSLFGHDIRLKSRLGAMLSYLGPHTLRLFTKP